MLLAIIVVLILASSASVLVDAETHKIPLRRDKPYSPANGCAAWFVACLLLWVAGIAWYLIARSAVLAERRATAPTAPRAASQPTGAAPRCPTCGTSLPDGTVFCHICGSRAYVPVDSPQPSNGTPPAPAGLPPRHDVRTSWQAVRTALSRPAPAQAWIVAVAVLAVVVIGAHGLMGAKGTDKASATQTSAPVAIPTNTAQTQAPTVTPTSTTPTQSPTATPTSTPSPTASGQPTSDKARAAQESLRTLQAGVESYAADHGNQYPDPSLVTSGGLVDPEGSPYVQVWPTDPYTNVPMQQGGGPGEFTYARSESTFRMTVYGENGEALLTVP
jgi:hypothetical protein